MNRCKLFLTALLMMVAPALAGEPRVMIVSIDGLRPDLILRAKMPNVRALMDGGSFSLWANTTPASITMPSHTSMLTGVTIERHGISANDDKSISEQTLKVPTIFDYAKTAGISSGLVAGKSKFSIVATSTNWTWLPPTTSVVDAVVADHAVEMIEQHTPRLLVVHFPQNDGYGHGIGWGTPEQLAGLANTDAQLGRVLEALARAGVRDDTTIILSADHGGRGRVHGKDDSRSLHIPWIINGPGIRKDFDLTRDKDLVVRTYDTFATACHVLGIAVPADSDGKPVLLAFETTELMQDTRGTKRPAVVPTVRGKPIPATQPKAPSPQ